MKSEERHQLQENDLAGVLNRWLRQFEPYSNQILIGVLAATVLAIGAILWTRSTGSATTAAWAEFAKATTADDYLTTADDHPGTTVSAWAKLRAGELFLNEGLRTATSDRKTTEERLKHAESAFQELLQDSSHPGLIRERALYGLAVSRETLAGADTQPAVAAYEEFLRQFPESPFRGLATLRIADLKRESTREFYAWFDRQERNPEDRPKPQDLGGGPLSGDSAQPFPWDIAPATIRPQHPDRPPSPATPSRAESWTPSFPADEPPAAPGAASSATPADTAPSTPATETPNP